MARASKASTITPHDEYQFANEEYAKDHTLHPDANTVAAKSSFVTKLKNKRLLIAVAVIISMVIIYRFVDRASTSHSVEEVAIPASSSQPMAPIPKLNENNQDSLVHQQLGGLREQNQRDQVKFDNLRQEVNTANSSLAQMTAVINEMNQSMSLLKDQVNDVKQMQNKADLRVKIPPYYIKAMIDGRAWIESKQGKLVTVKVGDRIPGYGDIQNIDVDKGLIETSSGLPVEYGTKDS